MSIAAIGNAGTQYDFSSMTSKQAFDAAKDLESQGKFSTEAAARLEGAANGIDYAPMNGNSSGSVAHTLADPTKVNWIAYMQQSSDWNHATPGTIGGESTDALLTELKSYQSGAAQQYANAITSSE